jgi:hypothetical protein
MRPVIDGWIIDGKWQEMCDVDSWSTAEIIQRETMKVAAVAAAVLVAEWRDAMIPLILHHIVMAVLDMESRLMGKEWGEGW